MNRFKRLLQNENGQDLIEYGLLAAFISVVTVATLRAIGPLVNNLWVVVRDALAG